MFVRSRAHACKLTYLLGLSRCVNVRRVRSKFVGSHLHSSAVTAVVAILSPFFPCFSFLLWLFFFASARLVRVVVRRPLSLPLVPLSFSLSLFFLPLCVVFSSLLVFSLRFPFSRRPSLLIHPPSDTFGQRCLSSSDSSLCVSTFCDDSSGCCRQHLIISFVVGLKVTFVDQSRNQISLQSIVWMLSFVVLVHFFRFFRSICFSPSSSRFCLFLHSFIHPKFNYHHTFARCILARTIDHLDNSHLFLPSLPLRACLRLFVIHFRLSRHPTEFLRPPEIDWQSCHFSVHLLLLRSAVPFISPDPDGSVVNSLLDQRRFPSANARSHLFLLCLSSPVAVCHFRLCPFAVAHLDRLWRFESFSFCDSQKQKKENKEIL